MMKNLILVCLLAACGSSTPAKMDAAHDSKPVDTQGGAPMLTVKNYLSWCSVSVAGGTASTAAVQMVPITSAGAKMLVATAASATFELGPNMWHHTDGDTGAGEAGTVSGPMSTATVSVTTSASKCVWVCCPFSNPAGTGCNVAEQCP
jgi:hypothetical protein